MSSGRPRSFITALRMRRTGASAIRPFLTLGDEAEQRGVDEQVHLRRMRGLAEDVEHVADAVAGRVDQVEALAVQAGFLVADVVDARRPRSPPARC
jgi:hypothetical protein